MMGKAFRRGDAEAMMVVFPDLTLRKEELGSGKRELPSGENRAAQD